MDMSMIRDPDWVSERLGAGDTVSNIAVAAGASRQSAHTWIQRHRLPAQSPLVPAPPVYTPYTASMARSAGLRSSSRPRLDGSSVADRGRCEVAAPR